MIRSVSRIAVVALFAAGTTAQAQLATFDDLPGCVPTNTGGTAIANGYSGFNWSNFFVADGPNTAVAQAGPGYANGTVTQRCIALNGFGAASELSAGADFIFNGGFFTAAFTNNLSVAITAFNAANTQIFSTNLLLGTAGPQLLNVNWTGVRRVRFASGTGQPGSQFVFDNFRFNNTPDPRIVPEPSTYALLVTGLAGLAVAARRRRRA
ncbi:MAG: PEP-CTERM sorting domain-containing protein [Gemmatimonadaceae bacterium]|jgi:hypothetical protein|nr:PEP-CTERM sorting domain-containing protein [Gemmatimonadaceae bacterium]